MTLEGNSENSVTRPQPIIDGNCEDVDLLPKILGMAPRREDQTPGDLEITVGLLEFNYDQVKKDVSEGKSRLRLVRDVEGSISGFTVVSPGEESSTVKMIWVSPKMRERGLGEVLMRDALEILPKGTIYMDVWGRELMVKLAVKMGFRQNPGGDMTNRYSYRKSVGDKF
jgi:ribosomal protein S18 acetylase RimI-like enzyme